MQPHPSPIRSSVLVSATVAALALLLSAGGVAQITRGDLTKTAEAKFTIVPGTLQPLVLQTLPDAACDLHAASVTDPAQTLRLYADSDGYVRVHVQAKQSLPELAHLQLDCQVNGKLTTYPLTFRADSTPTEELPAPHLTLPQPKDAKILPALSDDDARQLSDRDIAERGYAPRPDPATSPENYAAWLKLVSHQFTVVAPHLVSRSDITHKIQPVQAGTETSNNWSGYELRSSQKSYLGVQAQWNIPYIPLGVPYQTTYSAFWVGLDGDGINDLVQAGTEQNDLEVAGLQFGTYYAWTELLPNQPTEQEITGLPVNPNDSVLTFVWVGDANGQMDPNGGHAWTLFGDFTTNQETYVPTPLNGTKFDGREAEWIMERPGISGGLPLLSNYIITSMEGAYAWTTKELAVPYSTSGNIQITMYNQGANGSDNNKLSVPIPINSTQIDFVWENYH